MAVVEDVVVEVGRLGLWIQALGLVVVIWIILQLITLYFNRKRRLLLEDIHKRVLRIERKINQGRDRK